MFLPHLGEEATGKPLSCLDRSPIVRCLLEVAKLGAPNCALGRSGDGRAGHDRWRGYVAAPAGQLPETPGMETVTVGGPRPMSFAPTGQRQSLWWRFERECRLQPEMGRMESCGAGPEHRSATGSAISGRFLKGGQLFGCCNDLRVAKRMIGIFEHQDAHD